MKLPAIERIAHVAVRTRRHQLRRGDRIAARGNAGVADRPAPHEFAGDRQGQSEPSTLDALGLRTGASATAGDRSTVAAIFENEGLHRIVLMRSLV